MSKHLPRIFRKSRCEKLLKYLFINSFITLVTLFADSDVATDRGDIFAVNEAIKLKEHELFIRNYCTVNEIPKLLTLYVAPLGYTKARAFLLACAGNQQHSISATNTIFLE